MSAPVETAAPTRPAPVGRLDLGLIVVAGLFLLVVLIAVAGPMLLPYSVADASVIDRLQPPGSVMESGMVALLGTDGLGRDITTLIVNGFRTSIVVASVATILAGLFGTTLGLIAGYFGGSLDAVIARIIDIVLVFPSILLAIVIAGLLGPSLVNLVIILAATRWVVFARMARGSTFSLRERDWVRGAYVLGVPAPFIILRHVLPFLMGSLATVATLEFATFVMTEASLSFLGIGLPASVISLGEIISDGRDYLSQAYWISTYPGLVLVVLVVAMGLAGDYLTKRYGGSRDHG